MKPIPAGRLFHPPHGYEVRHRKLVVVPEDAATVQMIFRRYLALGSALALAEDLETKGVRSRPRVSRNGRVHGNTRFSRGALYLMLKNQIYLGEITHRGKNYPGEHDAIIDRQLFDDVSALLQHNLINHQGATNAEQPSLLVGKVWDDEGRRMAPNHACKRGRRYRYYASKLNWGEPKRAVARVPAGDLEAIVVAQLRHVLRTRNEQIGLLNPNASRDDELPRQQIERYVQRIDVTADHIGIRFSDEINEANRFASVEARLVRRGKEVRIAVSPSEQTRTERDPALIKLVVKAHMAREALKAAGDRPIAEIAAEQGYTRDYFGVHLRIAYLAPEIIAAILDGRQPTQLNRQRRARATNLPIEWQAQRQMLGFA